MAKQNPPKPHNPEEVLDSILDGEAPVPPEAPQRLAPVVQRDPVIVVRDDVESMLRAQAEKGLLTVDDFDEGVFSEQLTDYPAVIPAKINGRPVRPVGLNHKEPHTHPLYSYCTPVTRALLPDIDRSALNAKGFLQTGTLIWFVIDQQLYDRIKRKGKGRMERHIDGLNHKKSAASLNKNGGFDSGIDSAQNVRD